MGKLKGDIWDRYQAAIYKTEFKPVILLGTEQTPLIICSVEDIVVKSMAFLDHVSDDLSEKNIWLGNHRSD